MIAHVAGLNLRGGWWGRAAAGAWAAHDERRAMAVAAADAHLARSLPHVAGDYAGAHWLATFALLALLA
jgi:hypothetical protein